MGLSEKDQRDIFYGALVHDIGKIGIPDSILLKSDKLTPEEYEVMKTHPRLAYVMLKEIEFLQDSLVVPLYHHEKWNGGGYPDGLIAEDIPLIARVFAVADVWDALRSDRPYRKAWSEQKTREYIASESGTHFDPAVVEVFLAMERMPHPSDADFDEGISEHRRAA
jgi:HD-GYP domain-containing protein (c-di-GMP phosphodiesterase class II)